MSVVLQCEEKIFLFIKGHSAAIKERLDYQASQDVEEIFQNVEQYTSKGLRVLMIAYRVVP